MKIKKLVKIIIITFLLVFSTMFIGCSTLNATYYLGGYSDYLKNKVIYEAYDITPKIMGFVPINEKNYSYVGDSDGKNMFVRYRNKDFILNIDGNLSPSKDLSKDKIFGDKIIFQKGDNKGVIDIYGNVVLPAQFEQIEIMGDTILARTSRITKIYRNNNFISETASTDINFLSEFELNSAGRIFDIYLNKLSHNGYDFLSGEKEGFRIITKFGKLGYLSDDIFIEPKFESAEQFFDGYARVKIGNQFMLINTKGETVYKTSQIIPYNSYDGFICYSENGFYGLMDDRFNVIFEPKFVSLLNNRAYGSYLIDTFIDYRFFDIELNKYLIHSYKSIAAVEDYFITINSSNEYSLLDKNLVVLVDKADKIKLDSNKLLVAKDGNYNLYKRVNNGI